MKYTGTIIGLKSDFGSIYNVVNEDKKCYLWKANVIAETKDEMLNVVFNWNGEPFELKLSLLKADYYTGKILLLREEWGNAYFWKYSMGENFILKGDFNEYEFGDSECFIDLRPIKA